MIGGFRIVALVPMRHDSERVPGKNFRILGEWPLYHHIVHALLACPCVDSVVIDTDSPYITSDVASSFHNERVIVLPRPRHLRDGTVPMTDILLHDITVIQADYYLQTHSTNPFLSSGTITRAIHEYIAAQAQHDTLFGVSPRYVRLWTADGRPINHDPNVLLRTQDLPPVFEENSNLYLFSESTLLGLGRRIGQTPLPFPISREEAWDIDDELDFAIAEFLYARGSGGS